MATQPQAPEETDDREVTLVLDAARSAVAQEFQMAERLDAKARNQMTIAGSWYAIVSAVGGIALRAQLDSGANDFIFAAVVALAAVGAICLIVAMFYSYGVWRLRTESEVTHEGITEMLADAHDPSVQVADKLVEHYRALLARRRVNNKRRSQNFKRSVSWWVAALICSLFEFVAALVALVQS